MSSTSDLMDEHANSGRGVASAGTVDSLTPRQREILALIGQGLSTAEIARRLYRTVKTIESHRLVLGKRLGARNRVELARIAIQAGLTDLTGPRERSDGKNGAEGVGDDAWTLATLAAINEATSTERGQAFLRALMARLGAAFDATAAFVLRVGADGTCRSVAGWVEQGEAPTIKYLLASGEDDDLGRGEVRVIDEPAASMLAEATNLMSSVGASLLAALHDSRGQRLGTLASFLKTAPERPTCSGEILRLLAGRVGAELERQEIEDRFAHLQSLVSSSAERIGLWERDLRNDQIICSAETYRILGLEPHSTVPTRDRLLSMVHPQDRDRVRRITDEVIRRGTASVIEYRVFRPNGDERRILGCYEATPDITGRARWIFGTIRDVTDG